MSCLPGRSILLLPDRGISCFAGFSIAADVREPIALLDQGVESGLLLCGRKAMPCLPGRAIPFFPDCIKPGSAAFAVAANVRKAVTRLHQAVERRLICVCINAVPGLPRGAVIGLENGREACGKPRHRNRTTTESSGDVIYV